MSKKVFQLLNQKFSDQVPEAYTYRGDAMVVVEKRAIHDMCQFLRDNPELKFNMLVDLTCVDYLGREPRFEIVYLLHSFADNQRLRIKVPVDERDPQVQTVSGRGGQPGM